MRKRLRRLAFLFSAVPLLFLFKLTDLQIVRADEFSAKSEINRYVIDTIEAPRGNILDRRGRILATWRTAFDLEYTARSRDFDGRLAGEVSTLIADSTTAFFARFTEAHRFPGRPVRLASNLAPEAVAAVSWHAGRLAGVRLRPGFNRVVTEDTVAAHVIGYVGEISPAELEDGAARGYSLGDRVGKSGVEKRFDGMLRGRVGFEKYETDPLGRRGNRMFARPAEPGADLYLTIDLDLQRCAVETLSDKVGAIVMLEPSTGRILAMASSPTFSPDAFSSNERSVERAALLRDPGQPLLSRALNGLYPPGSTFKLVTLIAGLSDNTIHPEERVVCAGSYRGQRCWKRDGHGSVDMIEGFAQSCDVYFYQMGERIGVDSIRNTAVAYGWESPVAFEAGPAKTGHVPTPEWERANVRGADGMHWGDGDVRNTAIGQGYVLGTPLQVARLYAAVLAHGRSMRPEVVEKIRAGDASEIWRFHPEVERETDLAPEDYTLLRRAMLAVVERGTAQKIRRDFPVGAKTGTAENPHGEDHAWMVAAWPLGENSEPAVVAVALVVNGGHGSTAAGPLIGRLIDEWARLENSHVAAL